MTRALLAAIAVALLPLPLFADEVRLKDGTVLIGSTRKLGQTLLVKTRDGSVRVRLQDVVRIRKDQELRQELRDMASRGAAGTAHVQLGLARQARDWGLERELWRHLGAALHLGKNSDSMMRRNRDFMATLEPELLPKKWRSRRDDVKVRELLYRLRGRLPVAKVAAIEELLVRGAAPEFDKALRTRARRSHSPDQRSLAIRALARRGFEPNKLSSNERFAYRTAILDGRQAVRQTAIDIAKDNHRGLHAIRYLAPGLDHSNGRFRIRTAEAFGRLKDPAALPILVAAGPRAAVNLRRQGLPGGATRAHMAVVSQQSYIRDFDVEVAQAAMIANPVVGVIQSGTVLDVTVMAVTTHRNLILDSYRDAIREIAGADPGKDPEKWKEWLEKQRQAKANAKDAPEPATPKKPKDNGPKDAKPKDKRD
jgi:hypothetical protein